MFAYYKMGCIYFCKFLFISFKRSTRNEVGHASACASGSLVLVHLEINNNSHEPGGKRALGIKLSNLLMYPSHPRRHPELFEGPELSDKQHAMLLTDKLAPGILTH